MVLYSVMIWTETWQDFPENRTFGAFNPRSRRYSTPMLECKGQWFVMSLCDHSMETQHWKSHPALRMRTVRFYLCTGLNQPPQLVRMNKSNNVEEFVAITLALWHEGKNGNNFDRFQSCCTLNTLWYCTAIKSPNFLWAVLLVSSQWMLKKAVRATFHRRFGLNYIQYLVNFVNQCQIYPLKNDLNVLNVFEQTGS